MKYVIKVCAAYVDRAESSAAGPGPTALVTLKNLELRAHRAQDWYALYPKILVPLHGSRRATSARRVRH